MKEQQSFILLNAARREATYGTAITPLTSWYKFLTGDIPQEAALQDDDTDEVNGSKYPAVYWNTLNIVRGQFRFPFCQELYSYFTLLMLGNIAESGAGPYLFTADSPPETQPSPYSFSFIYGFDREIVGSDASKKLYTGCVVESIEFTIGDDISYPVVTVNYRGS